jgi:hypothetical protein
MKRNHLVLVFFISLLTLFAAIGQAEGTKTFSLGTSSFTIQIPEDFVEEELTPEDLEDDMVAYLSSKDFAVDIYQFKKEGNPETLADYVTMEGGELSASEINKDDKIGDIPVVWYRAVEPFNDKLYRTLTYIFEEGDDYLEICFWLAGENAEQDAKAIIETLKISAK